MLGASLLIISLIIGVLTTFRAWAEDFSDFCLGTETEPDACAKGYLIFLILFILGLILCSHGI